MTKFIPKSVPAFPSLLLSLFYSSLLDLHQCWTLTTASSCQCSWLNLHFRIWEALTLAYLQTLAKFEQMCLSKRRFVILYYIIVNSIHSKKLTSLAIIPNFLLQLFFKPGLPLFQCFGQSEKQNKSSHCVFLKAACIRFLRAFLTALFWAFLSIFSLFLFTLSSTVFLGFFSSCSTDFGFFCRSVLSNFSCSFSSFSSMSSFNLKYSQFNKDVYLLLCSFFVFWSFLLKWLFLFVGNHPFAHDTCVLFCFT